LETILVDFDSLEQMMGIFGSFDENINMIADECGISFSVGNQGVFFTGDQSKTQLASNVVDMLKKMFLKNEPINKSAITSALDLAREGQMDSLEDMLSDVVAVTARGKQIKCRTFGQKQYVRAIRSNTVTLCIGPAGTGKTYLAMAVAVVALKSKQVNRIILTRPAVEAGEKLGFLPGDLQNKVDPYLRPLYDALYDFMGGDTYQRLAESGVIEVAPLAYMRGRTLHDAFIILDEAQNCTSEQMKMFLTRFGEGSRVVVTGDITQIDLPAERSSGLKRSAQILKNIPDIAVVHLSNKDVVRHALVKNIIRAFEKHELEHRSK
jgi:phosphate starvation-inducible PhoH-like protein